LREALIKLALAGLGADLRGNCAQRLHDSRVKIL